MEHNVNIGGIMLDEQRHGLAETLALAQGRAHEFCGPARRVLAAWLAGWDAPVLWLRLRHNPDRLCPQGLLDWATPEGLVVAEAPREADLLACAEEGLRSGACALVVADLAVPVAMTPLRRLHLAAEVGLARRRARNLGSGLHALVLTPADGGTPGVESRWHMAPCPAPDTPVSDPVGMAWRLSRRRARMAPPAEWQVQAHGTALHLRSLPG
jgi:protein ImuA